jgi:hypothetical protein
MQNEGAEDRERRRRKNRTEVLLSKPRAESPYIRGAVEEYTSRTVEELGGMDRLTAGDKAMLLAQRTTLLVILCSEDELVESGSLTGRDGRPNPLLKILENYLTVFRQGQVALGLGKPRSPRERDTGPTMLEIVREYGNKTKSPSAAHSVGR